MTITSAVAVSVAFVFLSVEAQFVTQIQVQGLA